MSTPPSADHDAAPLHELADRLTELEIRYMEQGLLLDELSTLVREQDLRIDDLQRALADLHHRSARDSDTDD